MAPLASEEKRVALNPLANDELKKRVRHVQIVNVAVRKLEEGMGTTTVAVPRRQWILPSLFRSGMPRFSPSTADDASEQ